jgi:hypothetical protein
MNVYNIKGGNKATFIVRIDSKVAAALLRNNKHKTAESVLSDIIQKGSEDIADTSYETIGPMDITVMEIK